MDVEATADAGYLVCTVHLYADIAMGNRIQVYCKVTSSQTE